MTARTPAGQAPWPTASTRPVVLLGWPAGHSLSPVIHNAAFREQGIDLVYLAFPTPPERLHRVVDTLGWIGAVGANVTVPHKQAVLDLCDRLTAEAELVGAVNTLAWTADGLLGDNTDATGFMTAMRDDVGIDDGARIVVLGTGGAARAAAVGLGRLGVQVTFVGRRPDAAQELADLAALCGADEADAVDLADLEWVQRAVDGAGVFVNATPLGMDGEDLPDPFMRLGAHQIAYDMVYRPALTPFLEAARSVGARAHHGLGMLVAQAAGAYQRWTGRKPPLPTMSAAAAAGLRAEESGD